MKKVIFILIIMALISQMKAQNTPDYVGYTLYTDADTTFNCGGSVNLWVKISDWANQISNVPLTYFGNTLNSVYFTDVNTGYAVSNPDDDFGTGVIQKTTDGGITWTTIWSSVYLGRAGTESAVYFTDVNTGYVVTAGTEYFEIIKTTDAGNTWNTSYTCGGFWTSMNAICFTDANTGYATGGGFIIKTTDAGNTWINNKDSVATSTLNSIYFTDANTGYAVGNTIIKTTDAGNTWYSIESGGSNTFYSVYFTDVITGYAVGTNGTNGLILKTTDAGNTWIAINSGTTQQLNSVYFTDANTGYVVGESGTSIKTTDGGNTWYALNSGTSNGLWAVYFPNANRGYAVGDNGTILEYNPLPLQLTYNWSPAAGLSATDIPNPSANPNVTTTYKLTVSTNTNMGNSIDSVTINVNPLTINFNDSLNWNNSFSTTCGTPVTLYTNNNYGGTGTLSYNWKPTTGLSSANVSSPSANPGAAITYSVTLTTPNGCLVTNQAIVTMNPLPALPICYVEFDTLILKNSINWASNLPANMDSVHIYTQVSTTVWKQIGTVSASQHNFIDYRSNPYNQSYSYEISVKDTCGLESDISDFHTTITLLETYNSGTNTYGFTWSPYQGLLVENYYLFGIRHNGTDSLIGTVSGNEYFYNYTNPNADFVNYFVGFYTAPCKYKSEHLVKSNYAINTTGINELTMSNEQLTIFPNPANDIVNIDFQSNNNFKPETLNFKLELYSITGDLLKALPIQSKLTQLNISDLSAGVYIIKVMNDNTVTFKKIVKE